MNIAQEQFTFILENYGEDTLILLLQTYTFRNFVNPKSLKGYSSIINTFSWVEDKYYPLWVELHEKLSESVINSSIPTEILITEYDKMLNRYKQSNPEIFI